MNNLIVSQFSGSSLSTPEGVKRAAEIIKSDSSRHFVIVSAPGKTHDEIGITDMLYMCYSNFSNSETYHDILRKIHERYEAIIDSLGITFDIKSEIEALTADLVSGKSSDFIVSRGEYIMSGIMASYLGWERIDAADIICFNDDGTLNESETLRLSRERLTGTNHAVIPGFYGAMTSRGVKTFPRKGGDITGGLIACSVDAGLFEKWNMSREIFSVDPSLIASPAVIRNLTYTETLELNYIGVGILHDDVITLLMNSGIPASIRSTENPEDAGTLITSDIPEDVKRSVTVCIAGRRKFNVVHIEKFGVNRICGFGEKLLRVFAGYGIACEHCLSGIHKMSVVLKTPIFDLRRNDILNDIRRVVEADSVRIEGNLSLIAVIGKGMGTVKGTFAKAFNALADSGINVRMIDHGSDDLNIIIGVHDDDFEESIEALYQAMIVKG